MTKSRSTKNNLKETLGDILVVDDEQDICKLIAGILTDAGYQTRCAKNSNEALHEIKTRCPSLVMLDVWLQDSALNGLEILKMIQDQSLDLPAIMISGHGNIETAMSAVKMGAYDYIEKPFTSERLLLAVSHALEKTLLSKENRDLKEDAGGLRLIGDSPIAEKLRSQIKKLATSKARVFITGSDGAGKELAARLIHQESSRAMRPFIAVNASILDSQKLEMVLFGSIDGPQIIPGLFEQAHQGCLFLDEVAYMPLETQVKICRILTEQSFTRVGGGPKVSVDVRVITASSQNMEERIRERSFLEDLYHRLNVVSLHIPDLKERRSDIPILVDHFIELFARTGIKPYKFAPSTMALLQAHEWPGNIRQLKNCVEHMLIQAKGVVNGSITDEIDPSFLPDSLLKKTSLHTSNIQKDKGSSMLAMTLRQAREVFERDYLSTQINRFNGNISRTATFIGMERSALHRKLKTLGLNLSKKQAIYTHK